MNETEFRLRNDHISYTSFILKLDAAMKSSCNATVIGALNEIEIFKRTDANFKWKQRLHLMTGIKVVQITNDK